MPPSQPVDAELLRSWAIPPPEDTDSKEERGRVLVVGGSREVPGAVLLAGEAALRVGAGKLQLATAASVSGALAVAIPEALVVGLGEDDDGALRADAGKEVVERAAHVQALVIGVGMSQPEPCREIVRTLLDVEGPTAVVLDAAAITCLDDRGPELLAPARDRVVVTPNPAEAAALAGCSVDDVQRDPEGTARRLADRFGVIVAVKGSTTCTATPDGRTFLDDAGNVGLGTSGSGDVLAGAIAGLAARGADPLQATVHGIHLHAVAGDLLAERVGPLGYLARELAPEFPAILRALA